MEGERMLFGLQNVSLCCCAVRNRQGLGLLKQSNRFFILYRKGNFSGKLESNVVCLGGAFRVHNDKAFYDRTIRLVDTA